MAKVTEFQKGIVKILDYLYFHDVIALETLPKKNFQFYRELINFLKLKTVERGHTGLKAEYYKHLLLIGIDLNISQMSNSPELSSLNGQNYLERLNQQLCGDVRKANFCLINFERDLREILEKFNLYSIGYDLLFKFLSQILHYEFNNITVGVFVSFLDYGFLKTGKYQKSANKIDSDYLNKLFFRAMLFIEYEVIKSCLSIYRDQDEQIVDLNSLESPDRVVALISTKEKVKRLCQVKYERIWEIDLKNRDDLEKYLKELEARLGHNPIFSDSLAIWISLIGAWYVKLENYTDSNKTIYRESSKYIRDKTCTELARLDMKKYGFSISERTLFDYHNCLIDFYRLILLSVDELACPELCGVFETKLIQCFFYDPNLGDHFKSALDNVNANLNN